MCRFAGEVFSFAPTLKRSLKVSVSALALGTIITTSLIGGEVYSQSCTTSDDSSTRTRKTVCSGASLSASNQTIGYVWGGGAGHVIVELSASTSVSVATGTSAIFRIGSVGAASVNFRQAVSGQDIAATADVPIAIEAFNVYGSNDYVDAGNSPITISVTGNISVTSSSSYAIRATRASAIAANAQTLATNITISTANITAGGGGIWTRSKGNVSITAGDITASGKHGISVNNDEANTSSVTVSSVININVSSISVSNNTSRAILFTVKDATISANVGRIDHTGSGTSADGILVASTGTGSNPITVSVGSASVREKLISVNSIFGNRSITLTSTGTVTAKQLGSITTNGDINVSINSFSARTEGTGLTAIDLAGKNVTVNTSGTINARSKAVYLDHSGNVTISVTGAMTGEHTSGTIQTFQTTSSSTTNVVTITTTGDISNTNTGALGVIRSKGNVGGRVTVSTKNVTSSGYYAINIDSNNGPVSITTAGAVKATGSSTSKDIAAIKIDNTNSSSTASPTATVVLNSGSVIGTTGKGAIVVTKNQAAARIATTVTVNSGASMIGFVKLGEGNDEIKFNGGSYTLGASQKIDGGSHTNDNDVLNFNSGSWTVTATNFTNWETLKISSSGTAKFLGKGTGSGQDLGFDSVVVDGVLSLQDGTVGDHLDIAGNLSGSGVIHVDVNFVTKTSDRVVVSGTVTGNIKIRLNDVTPSGSQHVVDTKVRILSLTGTGQNASVFSLENNEFLAGGYKYTITVTSNRHIELNSARSVLRCTESSSVTGVFSCAGTISTPEYISKTGNTNISATLASGATVTVSSFKAISIVGSAAVTFTQVANGGSINATGNASGAIDAATTGNGAVNVTLTGTANLQGSGTAVRAYSSGTGNVSVSAGNVTASHASGNAIHVQGAGASLSVSANSVSAGLNAIFAKLTSDTGNVTINTSGAITASSGKGIYAYSKSGNITISTTSSVIAGRYGIEARASGAGNISISVSGNVSSVSRVAGIAIATVTNGGSSTIKIHSGTISGRSEAIFNDEGDSNVILYSGAVISGNVSLNAGADTLTLSGATRDSSAIFSGGTNTGTTPENDTIVFNAGSTAWDATKFILWENITVGASGTLTFNNNTILTGIALTLDGTASLKDDATGDALNVGGNLSGPTATTGGIFYIDVNFQSGATDTITVGGNVTGQHVIKVNNVTPANATTVTTSPIAVFIVSGTVTESAISIESGPVGISGRIFQLSFNSTSKSYSIITRPGATECAESTTVTGQFTCDGTISASEYMVAFSNNNVTTTLDNSATVNVQSGLAFYLSGRGNLSFTQEASGNQISGSGSATGLIHANTIANGNIAITLTNTASLSSSGTAIKATTTGTGNVTISTADVTANHTSGTAIEASANGGNISITAATLVGGKAGVVAKNMGTTGSVSVAVTQTISSSSGAGIDVYSKSSSDITVSASGNISADTYGIKVSAATDGAISVVVSGSIAGEEKDGVYVKQSNSTGTISISVMSVTGGDDGIDASNTGSGGGNITITTKGAVTGSAHGITVAHKGDQAGTVSVTTSAAVTGNSGHAIYAYNKNGSLAVSTSGTITGSVDGLKVVNKHSGASSATVLVSGDVTGTNGNGISLYKNSQGNLALTATGDVSGKEYGIIATNKTSGNLSINVTGEVSNQSGSAKDGIRAVGEGTGNIAVTTTVVTGDDEGIEIRGLGTGTLAATLNGAVTGNGSGDTDAGILIYNKSGAGAVNVSIGSSGTVQGSNGILVDNQSSANTTVNISGAVTGRSEDGIDVTAQTGSISIVVGANVTGANGKAGIDTHTDGGTTNVTLNSGTVTATGGTAIRNDEGNSTLTVNSGATIGANIALGGGVDVLTLSGGSLAASVTLDGGTDTSVDVINFASGTTNLTGVTLSNWERVNVRSGSTIAFDGTNSLSATQFNIAGTISLRDGTPGDELELTGTLSGTGILSIDANFATGSVDTFSVSGNLSGTITVEINDVTPSNNTNRTENPITVVSVTGTATANSVSLGLGKTIRSANYLYTLSFNASSKTYVLTGEVGTTYCDISAGGLNYSCSGAIDAQENLIASGDNDVTATLNRSATVNVSQYTAFALSGRKNITFTQDASGNTLNATGSATGVIHSNTSGSGNTTITLTGTATLQGSGAAIQAVSTGSGNVSLSVSDVTAAHTRATAIVAKGNGSSVSVRAGATNGGSGAIVAENSSTGTVSVTTTGEVTTSGSTAIKVISSGNVDINTGASVTASDASGTAIMATGNGSSVNVRAAALSAGSEGIVAVNSSTGTVSVRTTGAVSSSGSTAIKAMSSGSVSVNAGATVTASDSSGTAIMAMGSGTSVSVQARAISAGQEAIHAVNASTGTITVTTSGVLISQGASAIRVMGSGNVTVNTSGNVTGNHNGIHAQVASLTFTNIQISSNATVIGQTQAGIHASNGGRGSTRISANAVTGQTNGILAMHTGTGDISVNTTGTIIGTTEYGVNVTSNRNVSNISVTARGSISGAKGGIRVSHSGNGTVSVNTGGAISSSADGNHAISVDHTGTGNISVVVSDAVTGGMNGAGIYTKTRSGSTTIVLNSGAVISSQGGTAITDGNSDTAITLNQGATISGIIELGGGTDSLRISGGTLRTARLDGGEDQGTDRSVDVLTFASGSSSLNTSRFVNWERISFASGSTVSVNGSITVDTNEVDLKGTLSMQDNQPDDSFVVNGNLVGGGTLRIDVNFAAGRSDSITVSGNATGTTTIAIADITPDNATARANSITIATVNGDSNASTFALAGNDQFLSAGYLYRLNFDSASNSYQINGTSIVGSLLLSTPIALFDGFARAPSMYQRLGVVDRQRLAGNSQPRFWMRTNSRSNEYSKSNVTNGSYDNTTLGFQVGADLNLFEDDNGVWTVGVNVSSHNVESTINLETISGTLEASGFGIGGTATWFGKAGHFADVQLQVNRITTNLDTSILPDLVDADASTAVYLSTEFGHLVASLDNIDIYAQTQLSWGHVGLGNIETTAGDFNLHMEDGFTVRAGIHAEYNQDKVSWYATGNLIADTPDQWFTRVGNETFLDKTSAMLAEIKAGISSQVADNTSLFAQANFSTSIDGRDNSRNSSGISAGLKLSW